MAARRAPPQAACSSQKQRRVGPSTMCSAAAAELSVLRVVGWAGWVSSRHRQAGHRGGTRTAQTPRRARIWGAARETEAQHPRPPARPHLDRRLLRLPTSRLSQRCQPHPCNAASSLPGPAARGALSPRWRGRPELRTGPTCRTRCSLPSLHSWPPTSAPRTPRHRPWAPSPRPAAAPARRSGPRSRRCAARAGPGTLVPRRRSGACRCGCRWTGRCGRLAAVRWAPRWPGCGLPFPTSR